MDNFKKYPWPKAGMLCIFMLLLSVSLAGQTVMVRGVVTDRGGETLPGVNVLIKGTTTGTVTDVNGNFSITAEPDAVLIITYIGFNPLEVNVRGRQLINIALEPSIVALDEAVVIGYGAIRRRDVTGSVASVSGEAIAAKPIASVAEALTGKLAGVQVITTEGSPDAEIKIRVRGGGSITGDNSPLFIVDGFPVESISDISPNDIESVDVLKDASSTAIYGSRGANGVIIITTRRGQEGRITVRYEAFASFNRLARRLEVLSPFDYTLWQYERALLANDLSRFTSMFGNFQDIDLFREVPANDWQGITFGRLGFTMNNTLSISGGTQRTTYSFNYTDNRSRAIMQYSGFRRDNLNLRINHQPSDRISLGLIVRYANTNIQGGGANEQREFSFSADPRLRHAMIFPPFPVDGLTDEEGELDRDFVLFHPLTALRDNERYQKRITYNLSGNVSWEIIDDLRLTSEIGIDDFRNWDERFYGPTTHYARNIPAADYQGRPALIYLNTARETLRSTNTLFYSPQELLPEGHSLDVLLGQEYIIRQEADHETAVHGFPDGFDFHTARSLSAQAIAHSINNYLFPNDILLSFFGRMNYNYRGRFLLSATFRADGSSRFSKDNRWGYFPSAAFAWRMSDESFMQFARPWLDDLKLRISYGTAGNNNIPTGQLLQSLEVRTTTWINRFSSFWAPTKIMANPDLKWETTTTRNLGLDFTAFNGRLGGSLEAYINTTSDLLILFPTPGTGYLEQYRNMGKTENRGIEAMVSWVAIDRPNYGFTVSGNIGFNRNTIKSLGLMNDFTALTGWASTDIAAEFLIATGGSVGQMFGFINAGRYEVDDFVGFINGRWQLKPGIADSSPIVGTLRPGSMKLQNMTEGDNVVNLADRVVIGNANPLHTGGITFNGRLHGFDIMAAFNWSYGNDIYNANKVEYTTTSRFHSRNMITLMAEGQRWTNLRPDGTISNDPAELAALNANTTMWSPFMPRYVLTDWAIEDGSFLRLNTLTLGYNLPQELINRLGLTSLRLFVSGNNVALWTNYSGFDPEVSTRRRTPLTPGVDYSAYPRSRSLVFGLNLSF